MASDISKAFDQGQMGATVALKGSSATQGFQAATQQAAKGNNGFLDAMNQLVKAGTGAYDAYAQDRHDVIDERSNEIIRKLTPEQRRAATANGTLLYQDQPDVMAALRRKTGRAAAFDVETEIQQRIQSGEFDGKTRQELEQYRQERLNAAAKAYATDAGIDENDTDYKSGFDADIVRRNAGIFDLHAQRRSAFYQAQSSLNAKADLTPMITDPQFAHAPDAGIKLASWFNSGLKDGTFGTDKAATDALAGLITDLQSVDGGGKMLQGLRDQTINVLGGARKVNDLIGADVMDNAIVKAEAGQYQRDKQSTEKLTLSLRAAEMQADPAVGWRQIQEIKKQNEWMQSSGQMTPQWQQIIGTEARMIDAVKAQTQAQRKANEEAVKADNRIGIMVDSYRRRAAGENISVDFKNQVPTADSGEFKHSDQVAAADMLLKEIDSNPSLSDDQKSNLRAKYLSIDSPDGPFRAHYGTLIQDAEGQWQAAVITGDTSNIDRVSQLAREYAANPAILAQTYGDKVAFLEKLRTGQEYGIDPSVFIEQERGKKLVTADELKFRNDKWTEFKNNAANPELSSLPGTMEQVARALFDGVTEQTGNPEMAKDRVTKFLTDNTIGFTANGDDEAHIGRVWKKDLMADPSNVNSWQAGKDIIERTLKGLQDDPQWADTSMSVEADRNGNINIKSINGRRVVISKESLQSIYKAEQKAAAEKAMQENIDKVKTAQPLYRDLIQRGPKGL